jgi:signal transduction histidine kinase
MSRTSGERLLLIGAVLVPVVLLANAAVSYMDARRIADSEAEVSHTYLVLAELERYVGYVRDAEAANRGYLITGEPAYLAPYYNALPEVERSGETLDSLLADSPPQAERMRQLRQHTTRRFDLLAHSLGVHDAEGSAAARAVVLTGAGKEAMDALRGVAAEMRQHERALLQDRLDTVERSVRRVPLTLGLATLLALALVVSLLVVFRKLLAARRETEAVLLQRRDELEALVLERTRALAAANEDLRAEVAQRRATEERLRASTSELERSNRELEDFAFVASHDLQEPLRKIQLFSDRIGRRADGELPEDVAVDLERMRAAVTRMRALVRDLLAYARVGRAERAPRRVELAAVLAEVRQDLAAALAEADATLEVDELPAVEGDPAQLRQLFQNLVTNAVKFRREGAPPRVRIYTCEGAGEPEGKVAVCVQDNGIGFDPAHAERIFSPFERLHSGVQYPGTGIGLAFCRRIVEYHGGSISAQSVRGEGSTFTVVLPRHALASPPLDEPLAALRDDPHGR